MARGAHHLLVVLGVIGVCAACGDDELYATRTSPEAGAPGPVGTDASADAGVVAQSVDDVVTPIRDRYGLPSLAALVVRGGVVVARGASGVRKVGNDTPVTRDDLFQLGANVQAMTVTLAALMVEEGAIAWTSTLGAVLYKLPMHASYKDVTLEALLGQRAGAPGTLPTASVTTDPAIARSAVVSSLLVAGPSTPAGTFEQSSASILLASAMLEARSGKEWEQLLATRLFAPLGITTCRTVDGDPGPRPTLPWGHIIDDQGRPLAVPPESTDNPVRAFAPADGLRCSLDDWARFATLHLRGARGLATPLLGPASFVKMQAPFDITHGLGWSAVSRTWAGATLALNSRSWDASSYAVVWLLPDKDTVIVVASNVGGAGSVKAVDDAVGELVGRFVNMSP